MVPTRRQQPPTSHRPRISLFLFVTLSLFLSYILQFEAATFHFTTPRITCERTQLVARKMDSRLLDGPSPRYRFIRTDVVFHERRAPSGRDSNRAECSRREERRLFPSSRGYSFSVFFSFFFERKKHFFVCIVIAEEFLFFPWESAELFSLFSLGRFWEYYKKRRKSWLSYNFLTN